MGILASSQRPAPGSGGRPPLRHKGGMHELASGLVPEAGGCFQMAGRVRRQRSASEERAQGPSNLQLSVLRGMR